MDARGKVGRYADINNSYIDNNNLV